MKWMKWSIRFATVYCVCALLLWILMFFFSGTRNPLQSSALIFGGSLVVAAIDAFSHIREEMQ